MTPGEIYSVIKLIIKIQPQPSTIITQAIEMIDPIVIKDGASPRKTICIKADPRRLMKKRSPLVVLIGKKPFFSLAVGLRTSMIVNAVNPIAIVMKKMAVGRVHAIQLMIFALV